MVYELECFKNRVSVGGITETQFSFHVPHFGELYLTNQADLAHDPINNFVVHL
jgi:hypothetical protein